jgi:hypothetical protein
MQIPKTAPDVAEKIKNSDPEAWEQHPLLFVLWNLTYHIARIADTVQHGTVTVDVAEK